MEESGGRGFGEGGCKGGKYKEGREGGCQSDLLTASTLIVQHVGSCHSYLQPTSLYCMTATSIVFLPLLYSITAAAHTFKKGGSRAEGRGE